MALYIGKDKVCIAKGGSETSSNDGLKYKSGTVTSDSQGIITFPQLSFEPKFIAVWNLTAEEFDDDDHKATIYNGIMVYALKQDDVWLSLAPYHSSGEIILTNATAGLQPNGAIEINNSIYSYKLGVKGGGTFNIANETFNYAIYG